MRNKNIVISLIVLIILMALVFSKITTENRLSGELIRLNEELKEQTKKESDIFLLEKKNEELKNSLKTQKQHNEELVQKVEEQNMLIGKLKGITDEKVKRYIDILDEPEDNKDDENNEDSEYENNYSSVFGGISTENTVINGLEELNDVGDYLYSFNKLYELTEKTVTQEQKEFVENMEGYKHTFTFGNAVTIIKGSIKDLELAIAKKDYALGIKQFEDREISEEVLILKMNKYLEVKKLYDEFAENAVFGD